MASIPPYVTGEHIDQDTDSVFQARAEIHTIAAAVNGIMTYLIGLLGTSGTKADAIATMFSNQAVLFPAGTRMYFMQASPPPGWVQMTFEGGRYLMAVPDDSGGNFVGNNNHVIHSSPTALSQAHLPNVNFIGSTDFQGDHIHAYTHTIVDYTGGSVSFERDANGPKAWARYEGRNTGGGGIHAHNFAVNSGGQGWAHDHVINMAGYEPAGWRGVIGIKA